MRQAREGKRCAKTFLNMVGVEKAPSAIDELSGINSLMTKSREFRGLLIGPQFTSAEREKIIKIIAGKVKLSDDTIKFIIYLSEIRMISSLAEIIRAITNLYLEKMRKAKAIVMTPAALDKEYEKKLKASLEKRINKSVDIEIVTDTSLLGGILVKVGSTMYDSSIKGQLRLLKDELIKG